MLSGEVRIKFSKTGKVKFISHLDLCRTFRTAFIRAGIPIWYSQGFNPHPKMVFATTVSVGSESLTELLDIKITSPMEEEELRSRLNAELTKDIDIIEVYEPTTPFADLMWAEYVITFDGKVDEGRLTALLSEPLYVEKMTKKGLKTIDILPKIKEASACENTVNCILAASQVDTLGPDVFVKGITPAVDGDLVSLVRTRLYKEDMSEFK